MSAISRNQRVRQAAVARARASNEGFVEVVAHGDWSFDLTVFDGPIDRSTSENFAALRRTAGEIARQKSRGAL